MDEWNLGAGASAALSGSKDAAFVAAVLDRTQAAGLDRATFYDTTDDSPTGQFSGVLTHALAPKFDYEV